MNRPVSVQDPFGMRHVATRVALLMERQNPPMSVDGLAKRMTENGCPRFARQTWYRMIDPDKPQSVDADELLAFSRVFRVSMDSLMLDPAAEVAEAVTAAAVEWEQAIAEVRTKRLDLLDAQQRADEARRKLARLATTDDSGGCLLTCSSSTAPPARTPSSR